MFVLEKIAQYAKENERCAVIYGNQTLSYQQLEERSNAFAAFLLENTDDKTPVVIYGHKEIEFLPCMFGALKSGRAYVPVDITVPADRVAQIVEDVNPRFFLNFHHLDLAARDGMTALSTDDVNALFEKYAGATVSQAHWVGEGDNCYILFTSGSTGKPKGVPINRKNIENLARYITPWCETKGDSQVITNQISYSFDVSVISVYIGISLGKTLYTIDKTMMEDPTLLYQSLAASDIAFWVSTPSFAEMCAISDTFDSKLMPKLERFLFCGETLTHKLVDTLTQRFPRSSVVNTYGPTEATVLVTAVEIDEKMARDQRPIPIGYPLEEVEFRIVDTNGNLLPEMETGELQIISDSVSTGYYQRPDLTEKVFFETISRGVPKRGYKTGDACYCKDGLYYFCGRIDYQIKLNGFRIELEDIENNMVKVHNVSRAVVIPVQKDEKIDHLAAFVLLDGKIEGSKLSVITKIKEELKQYLPAYMIPRKIVIRDTLPVNTNGKVDRKLLAAELQK